MKLLLLQPPVQDFYETDIRLQPIGLGYLKAAVKKHLPGVHVVLKDYHQGWGRRTIPLPPEFGYLKPYYEHHDKSPFSTFYHYFHFGAPFDVIAAEVEREKPDLVGISALFSPYSREALHTAEMIKARLNVPVLLGGSHVSAMPEQMLAHPAVDFVIKGEGEKALVELLKAFQNGHAFEAVPGLGFKKDGQMIFNPVEDNYPIEEIPEPDFSGLGTGRYLYEGKPLSFIITSRSCPHRCTFCSVHQTFGLRFRRRSPAQVLTEIKKRYTEGVRVFDFEDDNLTYYRDEMKELCLGLIEAFPGKDVQFVAMNGISYLSLDSELLQLMRRAGFTHLNLALVSSDTTVRETTKRPHTIEKYLEVVEEASRLGFKIVSYQILGLPNETLESMIQTLVFNARLPVLLGASMFYLTPNSPIAAGFPAPDETAVFKSRLTAMAIETPEFSREDIYTLFITTRILNFLKGLDAAPIIPRDQLGWELLQKLLNEGQLFAATRQGLKPVRHFKTELFRRVWDQLETIGTQTGQTMNLPHPATAQTPTH
ncbi:MAG: B12-binding domain-containing radical SAM protein [Omnitrophica bacterium GWA2_52_12]|nr:MAG: B12-binding domain-containing radical SAM protein [Omnitrophica bacterium GWA2_52_12]